MTTGPPVVDTVRLASGVDIVTLRRCLRPHADECGLTMLAHTMLLTAASELARNCVSHGGGGSADVVLVRERAQPHRDGVCLVVRDNGPGIADVELAMTEGWTTGNGLGLGLPGSRRLADEFELSTTPGVGTTVTVTFWGTS